MILHTDNDNYRPLTLAQTRQELASPGSDLMQRLGALAAAPGHNTLTASDFTVTPQRDTGSLAGIPIGVKDNINVLGFPTTGGSPALSNYRPETDAPVIAALRAAGAIIPCKLNMHELAFGVTNDNATFGHVFNPFDASRTAGGSSGGSGAAVARGIIPVALGTDTGGSVRIPASFCGVVGFRPSTGRYQADGMLSLSHIRDTVGALGATVPDVAEIDAVLSGDAMTLPDLPDRALRLGLPADALPGFCPTVETTFHAALQHLVELDLIEIVNLPALALATMEPNIGFPIIFGEAPDIWRKFCNDKLGCDLAAFAERLADAQVRQTFTNMPALSMETSTRFQAIMEHKRAELQSRIAALYSNHRIDLIVTPTAIVQPPKWDETDTMTLKGEDHSTFFTIVQNTCMATLIGAPSLSIPAGLDDDGLPVGIMLDGPILSDRTVLGWAAALERHLAIR